MRFGNRGMDPGLRWVDPHSLLHVYANKLQVNLETDNLSDTRRVYRGHVLSADAEVRPVNNKEGPASVYNVMLVDDSGPLSLTA